ncbi:MAG: helix-turn-helix domain-containing protein [bacterium]|nr:helix-turn-helix domain-containing protein [bacterium]
MSDTLLTATQIAERFAIKLSTVYALCRRGELPHIRVTQGSRRTLIRFDSDQIEAFLEERSRRAGGQ